MDAEKSKPCPPGFIRVTFNNQPRYIRVSTIDRVVARGSVGAYVRTKDGCVIDADEKADDIAFEMQAASADKECS